MILAVSLMATEPEADELYRPYDTLKAIGFTKDEAKSFLAGIENAFDSKTIIAAKSDLDRAVKYRAQRSEQMYSHFKGLLLVAWGYAFSIWLYVVAMQLFYPKSIY